jgi:transcription elongation factor Elf1
MSIIVKNDDKEIVTETKDGNKLTIYEDVEDTVLDDIQCPFCNNNMEYSEDFITLAMGRKLKKFILSCENCCLKFEGTEAKSKFPTVEDFYNFVKDKIEG